MPYGVLMNLPKSVILISVPFSKHVCFDVDSNLSNRVVGNVFILVIVRLISALASFFEMDTSLPSPSVISA